MTISHLSTRELADRWNISRRTLDRWRWAGEGPRFLKLGGRVVYRIADIEAFEAANVHTRTDLPAILTIEKAKTLSVKSK
jgi:predicted DNA-binding transcriptional regulator AlpA